MKIIDAICVTSSYVKRQQIIFNESTGLIEGVGDLGIPKNKVDFYFSDDCLLFSGMGDVHIHAREDVSAKHTYKEDFTSAQLAMHNGGLTHAGDMPNNPVPPVDDKSYEEKFRLAMKTHGEIWLYAGIGPETRPLTYLVPYKVYMGPSIGELFFKDLSTLDETLSFYKNQVVSFHCEDPEILDQSKHLPTHHLKRPVKAEVVATKDALSLIEKYQLTGKLCHYSSGEGLRLIREARLRGVHVLIEVTPQHLYFDLASIPLDQLTSFQMNPPIRSIDDRLELIKALKNGEIDFLATDHAPHSPEEKERGISGLTGLDTFGAFVTWLIKTGVDPKTVAKVSSENPGDFFNKFLNSWKKIYQPFANYGKGLGHLEKNYRANFTVLNLNRPLLISKEMLKTKASSSPFLGIEFPGQVEALFIGGKKV